MPQKVAQKMSTWTEAVEKVIRAVELEVTHDKSDAVASARCRAAALEAIDAAKAWLRPDRDDRDADERDTDPPPVEKSAYLADEWGRTFVIDSDTGCVVTSGARRSDAIRRARAKGYQVPS